MFKASYNVSIDMETVRMNQKQILEVKNTVKEIKECLRGYQQTWHD